MALHPNVVSISDMMMRLRGLKPMDRADAKYLRKCGWTVGKPATYATCSTKLPSGIRLEATVTTNGALWIDAHNDGPTYNLDHGQDASIVGAASTAVAMLLDKRAAATTEAA